MSAMEKPVVQIFERKRRIIEQSRQQCHLWEHHLYPKLLLNGIPPPPWLCNSSLHADPQELNKDDLVSEVLLSQPQYRVPFPGVYSNLDSVSYGVQYPIGLGSECRALEKECSARNGAYNLPDCSVSNVVCASIGPPELDSGAVSPSQNQIEASALDSHHDPALSLAKLQRSKSRQKALEQRNNAIAPTRLSENDGDGAGSCAGTVTGAAPLTQQEEHVMESDVIKDIHSNIQSCSMEEMEPRDCVNNCSGQIMKSKISSQKKLNSLNVASSSVAKESGPPPDNLNESLEMVNQPCFINGSFSANEANKREYQIEEAGKSVCDERLAKSRSSSQARCNSVSLNLDSTLGSGKGVEICDLIQPFTHADPTDVSKVSDCNNGSGGNAVKDGNSCLNTQESNFHSMIKLLRSSCPWPRHDLLMTGGSVKSIDKSAPSTQPLISQDPVVSDVGSFSSQKDPDFSAVKRGCSSRSGSGKVEEVLKSSRSNICEKSITCSKSPCKKSWNVQLTELDARRLSSSPKYSKIEIGRNLAEKENLAVLAASGKTRAVTTCSNEGSFRPVSSSNLVGGSLLAESVYVETVVDEKFLDAQENIPSSAVRNGNVHHRSAAIVGEVDEHFDGLVEKDPSFVSPKVGPNVSVSDLPSDCIMSVKPKQLNFDDVEETSMSGICSPDLKEGQQGVSREEPLNSLEPLNILEEEISPVCESKRDSSGDMPLLQMQEVIRKEGSHMEYCASHFEEEDIARTTLSAVSPNKEIPVVHNEFCAVTSSILNHSSPSLVAGENSSRSLSKEVMPPKFVSVNSKVKNGESSGELADSSSEAVTGNDLQKSTEENVTNFNVGFPFSTPMDDVNVSLAQQPPNSIILCQDDDLLRQTLLSDGKITSFSADVQIFRSSTYDVGHSFPQHKRRKIEIDTDKCLPASSNLMEKSHDSIDQRPVRRSLTIEEDNPEVALKVQHLSSDKEEDIGHWYMINSPTNEMRYNGECQKETSPKESKQEKLIVDKRDRSEDTLLLEVANPSGFGIVSTMRSTMDEEVASLHNQVNCGQESVEHVSYVEKSSSSRRIYPEGNAKFSDIMCASPGIQCLDLVGTDETLPEFEGFIIQTDNAQSCIAGDEMELETMNISSNSIDNTSLGKSRFMHSPLCNSLTPYKLHNIPELYQSLPNRLLEDLGISSSVPLSNASPRSLSDYQPNSKGQYTSSVQTLWDRINSNFGSSGKRKSLKLDLPCITEENENVDEIAGTLQKGIDSEGMAGSNKREPLAEIVDNANSSTSVLQDDVLDGGCDDIISTEFNLSESCSKVKNKLENSNRKIFTRKGKENQNISLGANGIKRTTESVCKRPGRSKLSGKDSMKRGPSNNIVSNVSSFVPLVQQKQAAAVATGKRDIKVKALEAAEAAKRMADKKENERKMKKEVLRLQREKLELELQKKKKEEERKKKEEQMATKKRQREDEEKKEKEKKRKRVNDMKKLQEHEKIRGKKEEIEIQRRTTGEEVQENKKLRDARENQKNLPAQDKIECNMMKISENEPLAMRDSVNYKTKEPRPENSESMNDFADNGKVMDNLIKANEDGDLIIKTTLQEQSYEISPYKGSDDEDEDEDDIPNNKFIPSWASKHSLSMIVTSQKMDPESIFPQRSFCNIAEVLLPRRLQLQ